MYELPKTQEHSRHDFYNRFFVIQSTDENKPLHKLSPFVVQKALKAAAGDFKTVKRLQKGDILLEVSSAVQSRCIIELKNLAECPVQVTPHRTLNICKGVIRCRELLNCKKEEILAELKDQAVVDIDNITVKSDSGGRRQTSTYILTFHLQSVPKHIKIGYIRVPVSVYIPNPLRCFKCQRFGHGSKFCKGVTTCANCGQVGHDSTECPNESKCINCRGAHSASSKECPKWALEKSVQKIKAERGISFIEARKIVSSENSAAPTPRAQPSLRGYPMATVVRASEGHQRPTTRSIYTQTDFTWPESQDAPSQITSSASTSAQTDLPILQAQAQAQALIREEKGPSRPPRKTQSPPGGSPGTSGRKRQQSAQDRNLGARPKIKRPPKGHSRSSSNRYHALEMDVEHVSGSESDQYDPSHFT